MNKNKSNNFLKISQWFYANLQILSWSEKKRKMLAIITLCLISGVFNGSVKLLEIRTLGLGLRDRILYILSRSKIDWDKLIEYYERWAIRFIISISLLTGKPIWISIDDTIVEKDKRSKRIPKGAKKSKKEGFSFVTSVIGVGSFFIPLIPRKCFRKKVSEELGRPYISKTQKVYDLLIIWNNYGLKGREVIILLDSWYSSKNIIKLCIDLKFILISSLRCNRLLNGKRIDSYIYALSTLKKKIYSLIDYTYSLYLETGTLKDISKTVSVLLSERKRVSDGLRTWRYILCVGQDFDLLSILLLYKKRWAVETFHQIWKSFFDIEKWRLQTIDGIQNLATITVISLGFVVFTFSKRHYSKIDLPELLLENNIISLSFNEIKIELISGTLSNNPIIERCIR